MVNILVKEEALIKRAGRTKRGFAEIMDKGFLDKHYNSILTSNREIILSGGKGDSHLLNVNADNRMALVILIRISYEIADKISRCIYDLREIEPDMYFYPTENFHVTVIDILRGEEGRKIPLNISEYIDCISECCKEISPFNIIFDGLTASDNAVMVRGYYDDQLMLFRKKLREGLKNRDLLLEERYENISSHVTIARLGDKYKNAEKLLEYIERSRTFGTMEVSSVEVSFHNWYDTRRETISIMDL